MGNKSDKIISKPGIEFSQIKDQFKPFDIIVFRGAEFVSDTISVVEKIFIGNGDWTHVGMVITPEIMPFKHGIPGKLYIWESTMSGKLGDGPNDIETGKGDFGVQIRDLGDVIDKYDNNKDTRIGWCKLLNNPIDKKENESEEAYNSRILIIKQKLEKFNKDHGNDLYDFRITSLLKTIIAKLPNLWNSKHMYFCSELVTKIYELLDIIDPNIDPATIAPVELIGGLNPLVKVPPIVVTRNWNKVK